MKKDTSAPISSLGIKIKKATWLLIYQVLGKFENGHFNDWSTIEPTIADVLNMDIEAEYKQKTKESRYPAEINDQPLARVFLNETRTSGQVFQTIRKKLLALGYTKKDGPFLYYGTKDYYLDTIIKKTKVSREDAEKGLDIAIAMEWTLPYLSE